MFILFNDRMRHELKTNIEKKADYLKENGYRLISKGGVDVEFSKYELELYKTWVMSVEYKKVGRKTTVALLTTEHGFEVIGTSACVNPDDFNREIGEHYALKDALRLLGGHVGFHKQLTMV